LDTLGKGVIARNALRIDETSMPTRTRAPDGQRPASTPRADANRRFRTAPSPGPPSSPRLLHVAAIVAITALAYVGSFDGGFVSDDIRRVQNNEMIRSLDWHHLKEIFTSFDGANYMPLKVLSLAIDYQLFGASPAGFHVTNLALHVGCAVLVHAILLRLGMRPLTACLTALLWAVHPLQVESVAWISERKNVLSGLFFFAAFGVYLRFSERRRARDYIAVLALYVLAVLSKMNTMVLPAICLAYETTFRFRLRAVDVAASLPLLALAAMAAWYNLAGNPIHGAGWHANSVIITWLSSSVVFLRYLGNLVAPVGLQAWYEVPLRDSFGDPSVIAALAGLAAIAAVTTWLVVTRRHAAFWILWFGITLLPMLNIVVPFRSLMQDRYMYLAMLGPLALVASALDAACRSRAARTAALAAAVAAIAACTVLTYRQVEVWDSPFSLWKEGSLTRAAIPGDPTRPVEDYDAKVAYLAVALEDGPTAVLYNNLGALYFQAGELASALRAFEAATELDANHGTIALNLGRAYAHAGRFDAARERLEHAARVEPYLGLVRLTLARVHLARGDAEAARRELDARDRLQPETPWAARRERALLQQLEANTGGDAR
jgi:hypothetical protein